MCLVIAAILSGTLLDLSFRGSLAEMMNAFIRYAVLFIILQIFLVVVLGLVGSSLSPAVNGLFQIFLKIYGPVIYIVLKLGQFKGESQMVAAVWLGLPVGILTYGIILGLVISYLGRGRA